MKIGFLIWEKIFTEQKSKIVMNQENENYDTLSARSYELSG
ncbi:hypothetical protein B6N60_03668 [Richelia sinica FACHB-800]|uniref:Uncharacterized protein n=1 Tax=Richelia sinica FACHB-800 TaxID=1357546 RepID=A0A975Y669_9NOST|nr:hypothetical protein B6N60_03668 [Richelia sinica FACHB-800]